MAMPPILQRIENLRTSLFGTGTKILGTIIPYGSAKNTVCQGNDSRLSDARTPKAHTHDSGDLTGTLPIANGGTGATTAADAREALGITPANIGALTSTGTAAAATKLATARTITLSGDVTGSTSFDGSANKTITATLADSGVTKGAYGPAAAATLAFGGSVNVPQLTVDAKGRVTAAASRAIKLPAAPTTVSGNAGTATKLATARTIDGVSFNGSAAITHFGVCSTAAATAAKTVTCSGFTLVTGARITVQFTVTNTATSPTLNVNSTGAKAIVYRNSAISAGNLAANRVYEFVYDGTNYEFVGDLDTNTTYTAATATPKVAGTASVGTSAKYAREDHVHPAQTAVSGNAGTATTLATARTFRTNLASTATASFDGSADITPGVTGTLPVTNGGTGATSATAARTALGITLSDSVSSTSSSTFASSKAVKTAYDKAVSAGSNIIQSYRINAGTGISVKAPSGGTHQFIMIYDSSSVDYKITHIGTVAGGTTMTSTQYSDLFRSTVYFWRIA